MCIRDSFWGGFRQESEPWLNSEFGGVAAFDGDYDVSWCFKYQTDIQRQYEKLNGYVYTCLLYTSSGTHGHCAFWRFGKTTQS